MPEPGGILGEIVACKRVDVAQRLSSVTLDDLRARAEPARHRLTDALAKRGARFIMEVKRASPSEGILREAADPSALARAYQGVADAISVLTDAPYFGGSYRDLTAVRAVFDGPILCKDFIIDARQVVEARLHGADAVLVMLSVLDDAQAAEMIAEARRFGMDALVETHTAKEVGRAVALGAPLIGINNRDLQTLKVDLAQTERLAARIPADRIIVAESGIGSRQDVERLAAHADAFLVGSALMRASDPAAAARQLVFGRAKICGLTSVEDLNQAQAAGASFGGLILVPGTPRAINVEAAAPLADAGEAFSLPLVGVFRDAPLEDVADAAAGLRLHAVQLHGVEDAAYIEALRRRLPPECEIWAAVGVEEDGAAVRGGADRTLFDTAIASQSGGTGRVFDWALVSDRSDFATSIVAGGLDPTNAAAAARLGAYALDVGSSVEAAPGRKDSVKLSAFFEALRLPARGDGISQCA